MGGAILSGKVLELQVIRYWVRVDSALAVQGVVHSPVAPASRRSLVEMQHLRLHPRPTESVCSSAGSPGGSCAH